MLRVFVAMGTRPEVIKLAPVIRALSARPTEFKISICSTAQHREMLDQALNAFELEPDTDLNLMRPGQNLSELTARLLPAVSNQLSAEQPDLVLVQGDTTTVFGTALAAYYLKIPVGHVEAGLRTGDLHQPFPEEANRRLTATLAALHFAPTPGAQKNLEREGVDPKKIHVTGNTVIDALLQTRERLHADPKLGPLPEFLQNPDRRVVLITGHRRESFGPGIRSVCQALAQVARRHSDVDFVYPIHLNPEVQTPVRQLLARLANVHLLAPVDYLTFVRLLDRCSFVLTDSGGLQEEAPSFDKPVLVTREKTERPEVLEAGAAALVGTDPARVEKAIEQLLTDKKIHRTMSQAKNPFGDGTASQKVADILSAWTP